MIVMASVIGFPLPFALVVGIPVWFAALIICFACCFGRALKQDTQLVRELVNYVVVLICQVLLTFVYPAYLYGFMHVGPSSQKLYVILLPVIKIIAKNWISYFLDRKFDLMPQNMIFNVDVFNALYVSSSVQNSSSITTVLEMIALDAFLGCTSIWDISNLMRDIVALQHKIPHGHPLRSAKFIDVALQIVQEAPQTAALLEEFATLEKKFSLKERRKFVQRTAQVLFVAEFVILVEYTEVIVPFIFCMYTTSMYYLPNRDYYAQIKALDSEGLGSMLSGVAMFGAVEFLSLLIIGYLVQRKISFSTLHLLSFVLDCGWRLVQSNLFLWIFYTITNSLEHNGADFSWSFSWLKDGPTHMD
ncbi:hypothetical protein PHYSODRAFT_536528 [Phytophthora sojae]|uniref:Uncharacterized protein n=1 Tax=Phytophthora sojae (strain P6497) TaxID=1094619 RepID=G5AJB7_PHYSP|nr:hypothetical protein PHYSODRAFT_514957 [Phytophthora sojae]XP_009540168.1 hypothetical protein PHYSODRAFT_536528 [Phytophthora sojae]EGZ04387.1 hypothetical protein PHYSODRAFT_536528 [Phytophthora sojae]EGZ12679.1 hypothetical protein PHYSODRAFT_514957 [Phytophthora sojae]|eukprot:XP_009533012.1 hypothetical protein PHYSODRAFT_514957 [Phytophthora sojae]